MRIVLQRVTSASVKLCSNGSATKAIEKTEVNRSIGQGIVLYIGIGANDTQETVNGMVSRLLKFRVFDSDDEQESM